MNKCAVIIIVIVLSGINASNIIEKDDQYMTSDNNISVVEETVLTYKNISAREAKERIDSEKGIILLDVRTPAEYEEAHIPETLLIPLDILDRDAPKMISDKDATIFIYCRSGRRSITAAKILISLGYTNVYNLGGIIDWPFETIK
ncbi:rhodanese-like domain-containing protein [Herbivorax sp. ANBcel31]|uniref:rhodanese-like domain-containing protein n=1 Tax=Herbivorax sp. ANBcel31 TaxID=3069754 RepID=UPI0027B734F6|nr:rhodanese-like domain-containing protein [Herbivorax sp. ANBcel31]MDQ2087985.1 rhodanese-like domain-containing protein [Herbivorax sp. ANBcel31]